MTRSLRSLVPLVDLMSRIVSRWICPQRLVRAGTALLATALLLPLPLVINTG